MFPGLSYILSHILRRARVFADLVVCAGTLEYRTVVVVTGDSKRVHNNNPTVGRFHPHINNFSLPVLSPTLPSSPLASAYTQHTNYHRRLSAYSSYQRLTTLTPPSEGPVTASQPIWLLMTQRRPATTPSMPAAGLQRLQSTLRSKQQAVASTIRKLLSPAAEAAGWQTLPAARKSPAV